VSTHVRPLKFRRCIRKVAHKSKGAAEAHIRGLERAGIKDGEVHVYPCEYGRTGTSGTLRKGIEFIRRGGQSC
jgi:hypothetical protein